MGQAVDPEEPAGHLILKSIQGGVEANPDRELDEHGQAAGGRIDAVLAVQPHLLLHELFFVFAVELLELVELRLQRLHGPRGLELLDRQRPEDQADGQGEENDREPPAPEADVGKLVVQELQRHRHRHGKG